MRILHLYGGNLYGGVERLLVTFADFAAQAPDLSQEFALCYRARLWRELEQRQARLHDLGGVRASRPWQVRAARRRLRAWMAEERFDIALCHAWWSYGMFAPALRAAGVPVALWAHDAPSGKGWLERWAAMRAPDLLLTYDQYQAGLLHRLYPGLPAETIHAPVPAGPGRGRRAAIREALHTPAGHVVILQASRMERWKGHRLHLEALARLGKNVPWTAWFAGGAQRPKERVYLEQLQRLTRDLGLDARVRWLGERTDVADLMGAADIFCQPNTGPEPFGIVFLEALAQGLPVVACASGGPLEIVTPECGRLVEPRADAVAQALNALVGDAGLRARLGAAAAPRAQAIADPGAQMRRLSAALARVARPEAA